MNEVLNSSHADQMTEAILESISDGVFSVDSRQRITSFNRAAEEITGILRREALGKRCSEVFRSDMCARKCALRKTADTGQPVRNRSGYIINAAGDRIPVSVSTSTLKDKKGRVIGAVETFRDLSEVEALRQELEGRVRAGDLVSLSPAMQRIFEILPAVAESLSSVYICGQTGTGKELAARTIHAMGPRAKGPFIALNCGALPDNLLESELFGYKKGAFSGAVKDKPGRFSLARGGTIFLDEIGEISPALQVRLLRVLQEGSFDPLGSVATEKSDARVIVATNQKLEDLVAAGEFREDLYYRINVIRIELPPLRERKEDIPLLVDSFIEHFNKLQGKQVQGLDSHALALLMSYDWPGNVRELRNVIERSFVLLSSGLIKADLFGPEIKDSHHGDGRKMANESAKVGDYPRLKEARLAADASEIIAAMEQNNFNRKAAAAQLGIHKSTLFRKIKKLGLTFPLSRHS